MNEVNAAPSMPARAVRGFLAGALLGLAVGAVESCLLLTVAGVGVRTPLPEMLRIEAYYLLFCGGLGMVLHGLFFRRALARAVGWTAGLTVVLLAGAWLASGLFIGKDPGAGALYGSLAAGLALACVVGWFGGKLAARGSLAAVFALVVLGMSHGVVLVAVDEGAKAELGIEAYQGEAPPNLVMILIDTLRADRLGCYGYERPTSPVIDELAAKGTLFDAAYAHASWTRPSVASLMTSLYPSSHDIQDDLDALPASLPTLAQVMKARGYHTAAFSANPQISPTYGFDRGFDVFGESGSHLVRRAAIGLLEHTVKRTIRLRLLPALAGGGDGKPAKAKKKDPEHAGAALLNKQAFRWLDGFDGEQPFFLYMQYIDPHTPYSPPVDLINEGGQAPVSLPATYIDKDAPPFPLSEYARADDEVLEGLSRLYDAEIRFVDREFGKLLERLEQRGLLENTYIVVTSDHGEELYDHKQWLHGQSLFDELVRVPLVVTGPGVATQVVAEPVELVDLLPTAAGWCDVELDFDKHGRDLGGVLAGGAGDPERVVFSEREGTYAIHAVRRGDHKLIRITSPEGITWMEFDLSQDPGELQNLAEAQEPDGELRRLLDQAVLVSSAFLGERSGKVEAEGDVAEDLGELGYIDLEGSDID